MVSPHPRQHEDHADRMTDRFLAATALALFGALAGYLQQTFGL